MANIKSAKKRIRSSEKKRLVNKANTSALRTQVKSFRKSVAEGGKDVQAGLGKLYSTIDRAVHKGILHKNTAARHKSRLTRSIKPASK